MDQTNHNKRIAVKGRGASFNPANRFDLLYSEPDPEWDPGQNRPPKTEVFVDTTKRIINYNDSPDVGFDAGINPYRGCEHGCVYCFARPTHEYFGLSLGVDFETKLFAKVNAAELLIKELSKKKWQPQVIAMSGATDPYQPVERKLKITRQCLDVLSQFCNPVAIITKNALVTRDIDILEKLNAYRCVCVNISVTTLDSSLAKKMEPRASHPQDRVRAIQTLSRKGIPVNVLVAPIVPGLNDYEIPAILKRVSDAGAKGAGYVMLRLPYANKELFEQWLEHHFPERKNKVLNRLRELRNGKLYDAEFGQRMSGTGVFAEHIRQLFDVSCRKCGLNEDRLSLTTEHFYNPHKGKQYDLGF